MVKTRKNKFTELEDGFADYYRQQFASKYDHYAIQRYRLDDDISVNYTDAEEFIDCLFDVENQRTCTFDVCTQDLVFLSAQDLGNNEKFKNDAWIDNKNFNDGVLHTIGYGTDLVLQFPYGPDIKYIGVRKEAYKDLVQLCGIDGDAFRVMPSKVRNELWKYILTNLRKNDRIKIPVVDGKVNAILSTKYKEIPASQIFLEATNYLMSKEAQYNFEGNYSYSFVHGVFDTDIDVQLYDGSSDKLTLYVYTSDSGRSSVSIRPTIIQRDDKGLFIQAIPLQTVDRIRHIGKNDTETLRKLFSDVDLCIAQNVQLLKNMQKYKIVYDPIDFIKRITADIKINRDYVATILEKNSQAKLETAFDVYCLLSKCVEFYSKDLFTKTLFLNDLVRMLTFNYSGYDLDIKVAWDFKK